MAEVSKVYFTSFRTKVGESPMRKLERLVKAAGIASLPLKDKYVAIKINFGEAGNMAYLRPGYAKAVVNVLKELGAHPFLTDCNTLYPGSRRNALDHLDDAYENGFTPVQTGCQVIIADGLLGTDAVTVPIEGEYLKEAYIGRALMDADVVISLNHVKGHEATGFGGALKNLGMGGGSAGGKRAMHHDGKPAVRANLCVGCGRCAKACAHGAISFLPKKNGKGRYASINSELCVGCHRCVGACVDHGAVLGPDSSNEMLCKKIAEYALAVVKDRPCFHISIITDVSPYCDCYSGNDAPVIPAIGMFASFDPVALDTACGDACNKAPRIPGSILDECENTGDLFHDIHHSTNWRVGPEHAEKLGMGSTQYEIVNVD